jgi:hypothetical protein
MEITLVANAPHSIKSILLTTLVLTSLTGCGGFMEHSHCDETTISKAYSPDGKYLATALNRKCASGGQFTTLKLEEAPTFLSLWEGDYTYPLNLTGQFPIEVAWKDNTHLNVKTVGLQQQFSGYLEAQPPKASWKGIQISYK